LRYQEKQIIHFTTKQNNVQAYEYVNFTECLTGSFCLTDQDTRIKAFGLGLSCPKTGRMVSLDISTHHSKTCYQNNSSTRSSQICKKSQHIFLTIYFQYFGRASQTMHLKYFACWELMTLTPLILF